MAAKVREAIRAIDEAMSSGREIEYEGLDELLISLTEFDRSLQEARQNIEYFRGSLSQLPDIAEAEVFRIRDRVQDSLKRARDSLAELSREVRPVRSRIVHQIAS